MSVIMEVFSGDPPCAACQDVLALADEYAQVIEQISPLE